MKHEDTKRNRHTRAILGFALILLLGSMSLAQDSVADKRIAGMTAQTQTAETRSLDNEVAKSEIQPVYQGYKNVQLGMEQQQVREILGKPKDKGRDQDFFVFSGDEMTQVFYDADGKVRAISTTYTDDLENAPSALTVIGEETPATEDGSIYKLVRYETAGYWVSYNRTGGEHPIVTVTMQKI